MGDDRVAPAGPHAPPPTDECPLCPSRDGHQTEIPSDDYDVVVFENRFPSLAGTGEQAGQPGPDLSQ